MASKKVWIEILTPKQVMFFGRLKQELEKRGYETVVTSRDYSEVNKIRKDSGLDAEVIGEHGGKTLSGKLSAAVERMKKLQKFAKREKPDLSIYLSSPDAARVSFGLGIKSISVNDIPEAEAQSRLTVPISSKVVSPACIPVQEFIDYGAKEENIVQYDALDPVAWINDFKPDESVLSELGIKSSKKLVTFRTNETKASYLKGKEGENFLVPVVKGLSDATEAEIVVLSRYSQHSELKKVLPPEIKVTNYVNKPQSLLYYSDVFIGAGGTMSLEAALLGTPTLSCRQIDTYYEKYAKEKGLLEHVPRGGELEKMKDMLERNGEYKRRLRETASELVSKMDDPIKVIADTASEVMGAE